MSPRGQQDADATGGAEVPRDLQMAREMGEQSADIATLKDEVGLLRKDVSEIKQMIAMSKGSVRALVAVGSVIAFVTATVTAFITRWLFR